MKKILFLAVLASAFLTSCYEDKGSYDYTTVDPVELQPIVDDIVFPNAQINADYFVAVDVPAEMEETYDFHWEYLPSDEDAELVGKVCDGADLQFVPEIMGEIDMCFVAVHKQMKTEYSATKTIIVAPICSKGWLLLGSKGGETTLSFAEPASSASGSVAKTWKAYNNFITGLSSDNNSLQMQYGEYKHSTGSNSTTDDVALWISSDSETKAYNNESYEVRTTLAENRAGVAESDNIANWKDMVSMTTAGFLLEESGNIYMKFETSMYASFSDKPLEFDGAPYKADMILYADYKYMPMSKNSGFYYVLAIGKDGEFKLIDVSLGSFSKPNATAGTIYEFASASDVDGNELDAIPSIGDAEVLGGVYYFIPDAEGHWWDAHRVNLIVKDGADYKLVSFIGYGRDMTMTQYQEIAIDNNAGYLTGDKVELVAGASGDGSFSYFASGKNLCIINTTGEIINLYTAEQDIVAIDANPQRTEVGMALANGEFIILNVEEIAAPVVVNKVQYEVDSFVDLTYKYLNLDDAWDAIAD